MLLKRVAIQNFRSFLETAHLETDGSISILIGPNGGGKTNLLDCIMTIFRRFLYATHFAAAVPTPDQPDRHELRPNDALNILTLERHSRETTLPQLIELEIEVADTDIQNMQRIKQDALQLHDRAKRKFHNVSFEFVSGWDLKRLEAGRHLIYKVENGQLVYDSQTGADIFLQYLNVFEIDALIRNDLDLTPLRTPILYLPVNRSGVVFQPSIQLANFNPGEQKRQLDAINSRSNPSIIPLAIGRMAQRYRLLLERDKGNAAEQFRSEPNIVQLTDVLRNMGYEWELYSVNPMRNEYSIRLAKQGGFFNIAFASSGERELLTYAFAIFGLDVRQAIIVIDEPELHLHPKWQKSLLGLFETLAASTGNQFLMATHSPTFVSPGSVQYISRVYVENQKSRIVRMSTPQLPDEKHLLNIVNSQNNERVFFADEVILVEGISDRIIIEAFIRGRGQEVSGAKTVEIVSVGGKGLFEPYAKLLNACRVRFSIIADLDYVEQVGNNNVKSLFRINESEIKSDVIDNLKSVDGATLVASIDKALAESSWEGAIEIWQYIKSRRRTLKPNLEESERATLRDFIRAKRVEKIFILEQGAIEDYLPDGMRSKDIDKLIRFLAEPEFWKKLPEDRRIEIDGILDEVLGPIS